LIIDGMLNIRHLPNQASGPAGMLRRLVLYASGSVIALLLAGLSPTSARADSCPDLQPYYARATSASINWPVLSRELGQLMPDCLRSAEFFALYGAAQLNSGQVAAALESLERALLMDPDAGAAQVDYAEALFRQGQIFSALDMNAQILSRRDVPPDLHDALQDRQHQWHGLTRQRGLQADLLFGHSSNLNRGPDASRLTLTLSGEPLEFVLSPEFRPVSGLLGNLRLGGFYARHEPGHSHHFAADLRGRVSEDGRSDLLQLEARYILADHHRHHSLLYGAALTTLQMGGKPLFTGTEGSVRRVSSNDGFCAPFLVAIGQHQYYHRQSANLDGLEGRFGAGLDCSGNRLQSAPGANVGEQRLLAELVVLVNSALDGSRPGGDRAGWQLRLDWQRNFYRGLVSAQYVHTHLHDRKGYSDLLADGARRDLQRYAALLQYSQPIFNNAALMINIHHQRQRSNIVLFKSRDTSIETGFSWRF